MPLGSSLRRAMPVSIWPFANWSFSALKMGWSRRSSVAAKTVSKSPFRLDQLTEVEAVPPAVSIEAAFASSLSSSLSPSMVAVPLVRQVSP
jgi:hypothetical protein